MPRGGGNYSSRGGGRHPSRQAGRPHAPAKRSRNHTRPSQRKGKDPSGLPTTIRPLSQPASPTLSRAGSRPSSRPGSPPGSQNPSQPGSPLSQHHGISSDPSSGHLSSDGPSSAYALRAGLAEALELLGTRRISPPALTTALKRVLDRVLRGLQPEPGLIRDLSDVFIAAQRHLSSSYPPLQTVTARLIGLGIVFLGPELTSAQQTARPGPPLTLTWPHFPAEDQDADAVRCANYTLYLLFDESGSTNLFDAWIELSVDLVRFGPWADSHPGSPRAVPVPTSGSPDTSTDLGDDWSQLSPETQQLVHQQLLGAIQSAGMQADQTFSDMFPSPGPEGSSPSPPFPGVSATATSPAQFLRRAFAVRASAWLILASRLQPATVAQSIAQHPDLAWALFLNFCGPDFDLKRSVADQHEVLGQHSGPVLLELRTATAAALIWVYVCLENTWRSVFAPSWEAWLAEHGVPEARSVPDLFERFSQVLAHLAQHRSKHLKRTTRRRVRQAQRSSLVPLAQILDQAQTTFRAGDSVELELLGNAQLPSAAELPLLPQHYVGRECWSAALVVAAQLRILRRLLGPALPEFLSSFPHSQLLFC